jgi:hypothetical protein
MKFIICIICYTLFELVNCGGNRQQITSNSIRINEAYQLANRAVAKRQVASCPYSAAITCNKDSKYSNLDGSCNNLANPYWGKAETPFKRLLNAEYDDGRDSSKVLAADKSALPNPRTISLTVQKENGNLELDWTTIFATFGQFLTHDIAETAITADSNT